MFLGHFRAYVGKPNGHIDQAKSMPFASINCTNPRTNPWHFHKKILKIGNLKKTQFFWVAILNFFFFKKKKYFASSPWKLVTNYVLEWMGLNFYYYDGLQPKMRAGIINKHECTLSICWLKTFSGHTPFGGHAQKPDRWEKIIT